MSKAPITKFDGRASIEAFSKHVHQHNGACEKYWEKLRGNTLKVAKRLLYDYRNCFNAPRAKMPRLEQDAQGRTLLRTATAIIVALEERSLCKRTAKRALERLAQPGGLILSMREEGNDVLLLIDERYLHFYQTQPHPGKPPDGIAPGRHIDAHGLSDQDLERLQRFNLKWHHREL